MKQHHLEIVEIKNCFEVRDENVVEDGQESPHEKQGGHHRQRSLVCGTWAGCCWWRALNACDCHRSDVDLAVGMKRLPFLSRIDGKIVFFEFLALWRDDLTCIYRDLLDKKKGQLSSWPKGDWSTKNDVTSRKNPASVTAYYLQNRVPEPCHQERAEARPVLNKNRLGE